MSIYWKLLLCTLGWAIISGFWGNSSLQSVATFLAGYLIIITMPDTSGIFKRGGSNAKP